MGEKDSRIEEIESAIEAGGKFIKIFYDTFDKKRHVKTGFHLFLTNKTNALAPSQMLNKLYQDNAKLVWEGNPIAGKDGIQKFLQDLPGCYHTVDCFDCQPVLSRFTEGKATVLVTVSGTVKYDNNTLRGFCQDFTISSLEDVWKILSDCLRLRDL